MDEDLKSSAACGFCEECDRKLCCNCGKCCHCGECNCAKCHPKEEDNEARVTELVNYP
ncbi:MAG: hypothetical protein PF542_02075 [Nanoarchaeota archaeon]|nr:hypothetical protein [Nanoarchaeota archaeon]